VAKENFQIHPWLAKIFGKFFFWYNFSLSLILGTPFDGSLPLFQHVLFLGSLIHIPKFWSKTVVTRECLRKGPKNICLQN
jgi:hypothetical protein